MAPCHCPGGDPGCYTCGFRQLLQGLRGDRLTVLHPETAIPDGGSEGVIFVKATTKAHFEYFSLPKSKGPIASAAQLAHAKELAARQTVADDDDD